MIAAIVTGGAIVVMGAAMMPAVPALTAAVALAGTEFKVDNVVAWAVPAVIVPAIGLAFPRELFITC
jgi:hypothetical protein